MMLIDEGKYCKTLVEPYCILFEATKVHERQGCLDLVHSIKKLRLQVGNLQKLLQSFENGHFFIVILFVQMNRTRTAGNVKSPIIKCVLVCFGFTDHFRIFPSCWD